MTRTRRFLTSFLVAAGLLLTYLVTRPLWSLVVGDTLAPIVLAVVTGLAVWWVRR